MAVCTVFSCWIIYSVFSHFSNICLLFLILVSQFCRWKHREDGTVWTAFPHKNNISNQTLIMENVQKILVSLWIWILKYSNYHNTYKCWNTNIKRNVLKKIQKCIEYKISKQTKLNSLGAWILMSLPADGLGIICLCEIILKHMSVNVCALNFCTFLLFAVLLNLECISSNLCVLTCILISGVIFWFYWSVMSIVMFGYHFCLSFNIWFELLTTLTMYL